MTRKFDSLTSPCYDDERKPEDLYTDENYSVPLRVWSSWKFCETFRKVTHWKWLTRTATAFLSSKCWSRPGSEESGNHQEECIWFLETSPSLQLRKPQRGEMPRDLGSSTSSKPTPRSTLPACLRNGSSEFSCELCDDNNHCVIMFVKWNLIWDTSEVQIKFHQFYGQWGTVFI